MIFLAFSNPYKFSEIRRITPAYAGKRPGKTCFPGFPWDHPRLCGEKLVATRARKLERGSPPPMRGKVRHYVDVQPVQGITPAYAGKSQSFHNRHTACQDHPRLCGEKNHHFCRYGLSEGSPPPMRGKVQYGRTACRPVRITPAYAGKSPTAFPLL